jgi:hypothetical protein
MLAKHSPEARRATQEKVNEAAHEGGRAYFGQAVVGQS